MEISPKDLKARLDRHEPVVLLDVRDDWETKLARLDNAIHIPTEEIELRAGELDPSEETVVYCHHGVRSAAVASYLRQLGFARVANLSGGLDEWARTVDRGMRRY
jgi:sulfur-carrier protein adenylyltransferase/sulfurtransferase